MQWRPNKRGVSVRPQPELPFVPPLWRRWDRRMLSDTAFVTMIVAGWLAGNVLALLGCVVATFILVSHGDFTAFMAHVDNIASRYVAADAARRTHFEHQVAILLAVIGLGLLLLRLPRLIVRLRLELDQGSRHASRDA